MSCYALLRKADGPNSSYKLASGAYLGETVSLTHSTDLEKYIIPVRLIGKYPLTAVYTFRLLS